MQQANTAAFFLLHLSYTDVLIFLASNATVSSGDGAIREDAQKVLMGFKAVSPPSRWCLPEELGRNISNYTQAFGLFSLYKQC